MSKQNPQLPIKNKTLVAMSGGVDSTVAAILIKRDGIDCAGAVMKLFPGGEHVVADAKVAAEYLDIPFYEFDFFNDFSKYVIEPFIYEYRQGRTPNPCVICNKHMKFGSFMRKAQELGKDCVVTGHYAQIECDVNGRYLIKKGTDLSKDQSYVLYTLTQEQLSLVRFPLGNLSKSQVREIARDSGFIDTKQKESQDICFIPDGDYFSFISKYTGDVPPKGQFIDSNGNYLGESKGISSYTIGQRRGLGLSMPHPPYVIELRPESNTVIVGKEEMLYSKTLNARNINLIPFDKLDTPIRAQVKIRYSDPGHIATIHQTGEDSIYIEFDEPQRAITKGQSAVIYDGDIVLGGGIIY